VHLTKRLSPARSQRCSKTPWPGLRATAVAVRELISNALVHRDLAEWSTSRSIECRLTPDAFRLTNPGGLYGVAADRLGVHSLTSARNRRLVDICKFIRTNETPACRTSTSTINASRSRSRFDESRPLGPSASRPLSPTGPSRRIGTERSELLELLTTPKTVGELAQQLAISVNAVRKRLTSLRSDGLVTQHGGPGVEPATQISLPNPSSCFVRRPAL
jgi:ATP-dependent DNA helicase RecG